MKHSLILHKNFPVMFPRTDLPPHSCIVLFMANNEEGTSVDGSAVIEARDKFFIGNGLKASSISLSTNTDDSPDLLVESMDAECTESFPFTWGGGGSRSSS